MHRRQCQTTLTRRAQHPAHTPKSVRSLSLSLWILNSLLTSDNNLANTSCVCAPLIHRHAAECLFETSVWFSQWIVIPVNALFTADTAAISDSSVLSSQMFSLYFLFNSVCPFFLDGTFLDGCKPLIKFMKAGLSTFLKGCKSPTVYCATKLFSCGWEMATKPLLYAVNGIWVEDLS